MYLNLYDYKSTASIYSYGLTYLKTRVTTDQKHTIESQNTKKKGTQAQYKRKPSEH